MYTNRNQGAMIDIRLKDICKVHANGVTALSGVTLTVEAGQCLALVGPSGCGKTTLLRVIAGLEEADSGEVWLGGRRVDGIPARQRGVSMVFQRPALVAGRSVRDNLAWSWELGENLWRGLTRRLGGGGLNVDQDRALNEVAGLLGIGALLDRRAGELSGGQQQRVALGRALLRRAPVCLLDEPLGHLDAALRLQLRRDLRLLSRRFPATIVHVTHDPGEALAVGDQVAVLHKGQVQQMGSPMEVLRTPANRFVAEFCHPPGPMSFVEGGLDESAGDMAFVAAPWLRLAVPHAVRARLHGMDAVTLGIEGREIKIIPVDAEESAPPYTIEMDVALTEFAPQGRWVTCRRDGMQIIGICEDGSSSAIGARAMLAITLDNAFWFDTTTGVTLGAPAG
jgi:ABC-type sugar transport system ATPase subunit